MAELKILGRNPVLEALASGAPLRRILIARGIEGSFASRLAQQAEDKSIPIETVSRIELDRFAGTTKHQGVVVLMPKVEYVNLETLITSAKSESDKPVVILLDGIEDPRNVGAILRVAEGAGMNGVVITKRRCAEVTAAAIKTSAGAAFHLPIAQVANLAAGIEVLKKEGWWIVGLEDSAEETIYAMDGSLALAIVLGSEGKGLHRLVRDKCDFLYRIPMRGRLSSLNVATAAAIVCYEIVRQRTTP